MLCLHLLPLLQERPRSTALSPTADQQTAQSSQPEGKGPKDKGASTTAGHVIITQTTALRPEERDSASEQTRVRVFTAARSEQPKAEQARSHGWTNE